MERSFEVLVHEYEPALRAYVVACLSQRYELADSSVVQDLVQETFLSAWTNFSRYDTTRPFAAWLRGIARNKILMHIRSVGTAVQHVRFLSPDALEAISDSFAPMTSHGHSFNDSLHALKSCLAALNQPDRYILDQTYGQHQACTTIATELGRSAEAIRKRLQRARLQLRECILGKLKMGESSV